jgi:hypothetical protein
VTLAGRNAARTLHFRNAAKLENGKAVYGRKFLARIVFRDCLIAAPFRFRERT